MTSLYITESGAFLKKSGGHVVCGRNNEILLEVPFERVDDVTLVDSVQISSQLLTEFLTKQIPITWLSSSGRFFGTLVHNQSVDPLKHQQQFLLLSEGTFYFRLAKRVIAAKAHNQLTLLRRYNRRAASQLVENAIHKIFTLREQMRFSEDTARLMGYEGAISRIYFNALGELAPLGFKFDKRTRMPPQDPFNSLLSLGYSMLFNEVLAALMATGLHPYVGFMHRLKRGHAALVSDLMEEWRAVIVDSLVLSLLHRQMLDEKMFHFEAGGCFLEAPARKIFLAAYNKKLRSVNQYFQSEQSFREGIKQQCRAYSSALMAADFERYIPLFVR